MRSKLNCSDPSLMQLDLFPKSSFVISSSHSLKSIRKKPIQGTFPLQNERIEFCKKLWCLPCGSLSAVLAFSSLYIDCEFYTKEDFLYDIKNYF